jgi:hypothetical protein
MIRTKRPYLVVLLEGRVLGGEGLPRGIPLAPLASFAGGRALGVVLPDVLAALLEVAALRAPALPPASHLTSLSHACALLLPLVPARESGGGVAGGREMSRVCLRGLGVAARRAMRLGFEGRSRKEEEKAGMSLGEGE